MTRLRRRLARRRPVTCGHGRHAPAGKPSRALSPLDGAAPHAHAAEARGAAAPDAAPHPTTRHHHRTATT